MFLRTDTEWRYWEATSKLGKKFKKRRKRHVHHFRCDECEAEFSRVKGRIKGERLETGWKHFCDKCQRIATQKCSVEARKNNLKSQIGQKIIDSSGYVAVYVGDTHPFKKSYGGRIREHVLVVERHLKRALKKGEVVHHVDGDKTNNKLSNLQVMSKAEHNECHGRIEEVVFQLYRQGMVGYNKKTRKYFIKDGCGKSYGA